MQSRAVTVGCGKEREGRGEREEKRAPPESACSGCVMAVGGQVEGGGGSGSVVELNDEKKAGRKARSGYRRMT